MNYSRLTQETEKFEILKSLKKVKNLWPLESFRPYKRPPSPSLNSNKVLHTVCNGDNTLTSILSKVIDNSLPLQSAYSIVTATLVLYWSSRSSRAPVAKPTALSRPDILHLHPRPCCPWNANAQRTRRSRKGDQSKQLNLNLKRATRPARWRVATRSSSSRYPPRAPSLAAGRR
jgi:hypothetical protein